MSSLRISHVGALLTTLAFALGGLWAWRPVVPPPHALSPLDVTRLALALPVALWLPGALLAARWFEQPNDGGLDPLWLSLSGAGLNVALHFAHLNLLKLTGLPVHGAILAPLLGLEGLITLWALRGSNLRLASPGPAARVGLGVGGGVLLLGVLAAGPSVWRDSSWYWTSPHTVEGWATPSDPGALRREADWPAGVAYVPRANRLLLHLRSDSGEEQRADAVLLVHGPVGGAAHLLRGDEELDAGRIDRRMRWGLDAGDTEERYAHWGSLLLRAPLRLAPGDNPLILELGPGAAGDYAVVDWSGLDSGEVYLAGEASGRKQLEPFQLLNVVENVRWADEIVSDELFPGRTLDGQAALSQPPAWSYLYATVRILGTPQLAAATALLLAILAAVAAAAYGFAAPRGAPDRGSAALLAGTSAAIALLLGRSMTGAGAANFPDSLYALALLVAVAAAADRRAGTFVVWASLASLLRYPGAVVVGLSLGLLAVLEPAARAWIRAAATRWVGVLAAWAALALAVALATGRLEPWLHSLYFETLPEHFANHPDPLPWLLRPLEFARVGLLFGGAVVLAGLPPRGTRARLALGTALLYAPFLAFIDHFTSHYFLPLIALGVAGTGASALASRARLALACGLALGLLLLPEAVWI